MLRIGQILNTPAAKNPSHSQALLRICNTGQVLRILNTGQVLRNFNTGQVLRNFNTARC